MPGGRAHSHRSVRRLPFSVRSPWPPRSSSPAATEANPPAMIHDGESGVDRSSSSPRVPARQIPQPRANRGRRPGSRRSRRGGADGSRYRPWAEASPRRACTSSDWSAGEGGRRSALHRRSASASDSAARRAAARHRGDPRRERRRGEPASRWRRSSCMNTRTGQRVTRLRRRYLPRRRSHPPRCRPAPSSRGSAAAPSGSASRASAARARGSRFACASGCGPMRRTPTR